MGRTFLIVCTMAALGGCTTLSSDKAPVCDGKHRRPANLYGSVLSPASPPASAPAKPAAVSAASPPSYPSCGA